MERYATSQSGFSTVTITIPNALQQQADVIAAQQGETLSELICLALASYVDTSSNHSQAKTAPMSLENARVLMRQLGLGLGAGNAPHNGARNHDEYLYGHK